jgi:peptidyl-tRNA hydrolase, PTH1 family
MLWLVVGLGNPGPEYEATRHNIGQLVVDQLAKSNSAKWSSHKSRCDIAEFKLGVGIDAPSVIVAKSKSYMNESGGPVKALANFYKVELANIIILHDELDIPFAAIRSKVAGGDNGHNGLKSLTSSFGSADYLRVRLDPADYVLKQFASAEKKELLDFILRGADCVESLITQGLERTQSAFNS